MISSCFPRNVFSVWYVFSLYRIDGQSNIFRPSGLKLGLVFGKKMAIGGDFMARAINLVGDGRVWMRSNAGARIMH